jgi:hypothetical protein
MGVERCEHIDLTDHVTKRLDRPAGYRDTILHPTHNPW